MAATPYRSTPPEPSACPRCGATLGARRIHLCNACFFGRYDILAVIGMMAIGAGVLTGAILWFGLALFIAGLGVVVLARGQREP